MTSDILTLPTCPPFSILQYKKLRTFTEAKGNISVTFTVSVKSKEWWITFSWGNDKVFFCNGKIDNYWQWQMNENVKKVGQQHLY